MKLISIVSGCFNEEDNVELLYERIREVFRQLPQYRYEIIFIDNASTDGTVAVLKGLAAKDRRVKLIVGMRNFGAIRSSFHAFRQAKGDAVILMASDLQEPPELIPEMIKFWESGEKIAVGVKEKSEENWLIYALRSAYYRALNMMANVELIEHFTGFGLYDQTVVSEMRKLDDRYPYLRGLISELGYRPARINYVQPKRQFGKSHTNWLALYDLAMVGLTSHSIVPMRLATVTGFSLAMFSLIVALFYLIYKLVFWQSFALGIAPLIIGMFGMFSIQLMFIGLLGEYIGSSHRQLLHRPLVVERERINFEEEVLDRPENESGQAPTNASLQEAKPELDNERGTVSSDQTKPQTNAPFVGANDITC